MKCVRRRHLFAAFTLLAAFGCNREATSASEPSRSTAAALDPAATAPASNGAQTAAAPAGSETPRSDAAGTTAGAEPSAGKSSFKEDTFELVIRPVGTYAANKDGSAEIELLAKDPYHTNKEYPYKFTVKETPGLKVAGLNAKGELKDVKREEKRVVMTVAVKPESAGKKTLAGVFALSVCTEERCLIEKRELALELDVN
jgi:hypothetical protein